jgi:hypothetical protein
MLLPETVRFKIQWIIQHGVLSRTPLVKDLLCPNKDVFIYECLSVDWRHPTQLGLGVEISCKASILLHRVTDVNGLNTASRADAMKIGDQPKLKGRSDRVNEQEQGNHG